MHLSPVRMITGLNRCQSPDVVESGIHDSKISDVGLIGTEVATFRAHAAHLGSIKLVWSHRSHSRLTTHTFITQGAKIPRKRNREKMDQIQIVALDVRASC